MKKKKIVIILAILLFLVLIGTVSAVLLENDVEVEPNSELTYYLDVTYDGVDKYGVESSNTAIAQINSGYIYVEDKIPEGLEFVGFVTTADGTIGATERNTNKEYSGYVVDDTKETSKTEGKWNSGKTEYTYHGLHYTKADRTVRFTVKNLKAGGKLTVGIITKTPESVDDASTSEKEIRRDFYNFATAVEDMLNSVSNTVHVFMGKADAILYTVKYEYEGALPENVPSLSDSMKFSEGSSVGVAGNIEVAGYTFSGWTSSDVSIANGSFKMPNKDVVLKGSFTKKDSHKVKYEISGDRPKDYVAPLEKEYYANSTVIVDSLKVGDIIDGYKFLGWETKDVTISADNDFVIGDNDVTLIGKFEQIKYKVEYKFYDTVLPENSDSLLPETKEYAPGEKITITTVADVTGYEFLGWYSDDTFKMPEKDVVIYGEWKKVIGTFEPKIEIEILDKKDSYKKGDTVEFRLAVTNQNNFPIKEVIVSEKNKDIEFKENTNYKKESANFVTIDKIEANGVVYLYSSYVVTDNDEGKIKNEVEILGSLADNGYSLVDKDYKANYEFNVVKDKKSDDKKDESDKKPNVPEEPKNESPSQDSNDFAGNTNKSNQNSNVSNGNLDESKTNVVKPENNTNAVEKANSKNIKTGDNVIFYVVVLIMAVIVFIITKKKSVTKKQKKGGVHRREK